MGEFLENLGEHYRDRKKRRGEIEQILTQVESEVQGLRKTRDYYETWGCAYQHLKKESRWNSVDVFISGGGSKIPYVEKVFGFPWWNQIKVQYPVQLLPQPDDYKTDGIPAPFERMSVAYGLSRPKPELEEYVLPSVAPDHTPPKLPELQLDHEILYAK
jgi:hypothetical protein